ncbi:MAG: FtsX-like permease family protein [bacterium]
MREPSSSSWRDTLIVIAIFGVLGMAVLAGFVLFARPPAQPAPRTVQRGYDETALLAALSATNLDACIAEIAAAGAPRDGERAVGRLSGSPGFYRTAELIEKTFRDAGLEVLTQALPVVVPETVVCDIRGEDGRPLEGVTLYPFTPSGMTPVALPPEGVRARLIAAESTSLTKLNGHRPEETIVLAPLDAADDWMSLASAGVPALIVQEDPLADILKASPDQPGPWRALDNSNEVGFPRLVAYGPIARHAGEWVTLRAQVAWRTKTVRNVLGVLRGRQPGREALVVTAFYDSTSLVPERAPGAEPALSLAAMLACAQALSPYRGQLERDVVFVATAGHAQGLAGVGRLMETIESASPRRADYRSFEMQLEEERERLRFAQEDAPRVLDVLESDKFSRDRWLTEQAPFRIWFESQFAVAAGEIALERRDAALGAKLTHVRAGSPTFRDGFDFARADDAARKITTNTHPLLRAYLDAKFKENRTANLVALSFLELPAQPEFRTYDYVARARDRFREIAAWHKRQIIELGDMIAVRRLFESYERTLTLNLELYSGGVLQKRDLSLLVGIGRVGSAVEPQVTDIANTLTEMVPRTNSEAAWQVVTWGASDAKGSAMRPNRHSTWKTELESEPWFLCGRLAFTLVNYDFFSSKLGTPEDNFTGLPKEVFREHVLAFGRTCLAVGVGRVPFKTIAVDLQRRVGSCYGGVFTTIGGGAMKPSHPMAIRTFVRPCAGPVYSELDSRGIQLCPSVETNPYGEYRRMMFYDLSPYVMLQVDAARFDSNGRITYFKDAAPAAQSIFNNEKVANSKCARFGGSAPAPIHVGVFRCAPVTLYDSINPKTLKSFRATSYLSANGLVSPARFRQNAFTMFLDPEFRFYVAGMDGAPGNEEALAYRDFLCRIPADAPIARDEPELWGLGYLAADTPVLIRPHLEAAVSMLRTAEKRLVLQRRFGMADAQMLSFHQTATNRLEQARQLLEKNNPAQSAIAASASLAYAINNHPVIRERISQAVIGILWYLGLLVPFVFFAEKLFFGFTDIRRQLLANGLIFIAIFVLLRLFHPAFQMVRSSLVILLGFLILFLTLMVTAMVGSKFQQNLRELRSREGRVEGADLNRAGVIGTAFLLGLNNMRRRKVRTGLTCATLVLITFVMICFTSVSTDLVDVEYTTGRSVWNGLMIRKPNFMPLESSEVAGVVRLYGERYPITTWQWLSSVQAVGNTGLQNPELIVDREYTLAGGRAVKRARLNGVIRMEWNETQFSGVDRSLLTHRGWFQRPPANRAQKIAAARDSVRERFEVIIPDTAARDLGLSVEDVDNGRPTVTIRGDTYEVRGIMDTLALAKYIGLDGQSILPYDLNSVQTLGSKGNTLIVPEDVRRISAAQVMFVNRMPALKSGEQALVVACAVLFPGVPYQIRPDDPVLPAVGHKEQRQTVLEYLERVSEPACYAVNGIAYYGSRQRARSLAGLLDLLVPLLLAALTVFNTMRSSVYERRDEIYVYNAVGIAPNHVFFIFMAEACVYAVMGAMLGYLLSQGSGRLLSAFGLTGGLNMEYSSIETIYASLAIMVATLLSTILPARDAARLAAPSDTVSWTLPKRDGDMIELTLPFTFTPHDRVAVVGYFRRWLDANGTGSSGPFYCATPEALLIEQPAADGGAGTLTPAIGTTIWLKPYDLGISQHIEIAMPTDPETGEFVARVRLTRLSGHTAAWEKRVRPFLGVLRKQLLNWRVTTPEERHAMFAEARAALICPPAATTETPANG